MNPSAFEEIEQTTEKCRICKKPFLSKSITLGILGEKILKATTCEPCLDRRDPRRLAWAELCPSEFRLNEESEGNTSLARMDAENPNWKKALDWEFQKRGLLVRGETGHCKTRAVWRLLRNQFDAHKTIIARTAGQLDRECRDAGGRFTLTAWFNKLARVDILFIDDLGKGAWTQATEAQFFDLVDERTREGRPLIITTNDSGSSLAGRLSDDRGEPLIRRLRDYCATITL